MIEDFQLLNLKNFYLEQVRVKSAALKKNPLGDSPEKVSPVMVPKVSLEKNYPWFLCWLVLLAMARSI